MWKQSLLAICLALGGWNLAAAQSESLPQARGRSAPPRGGVYKSTISPHWFDDNQRFWYRNDLRDGVREYVLVEAESGQRRPAFDHGRLAEALREAGQQDADAARLALDGLEFDTTAQVVRFRTGGKEWRLELASYQLSPGEPREPGEGGPRAELHPDDAPRASTRTGAETELRFVNRTADQVELFWLDPAGQRQSYGTLAAGGEKSQHSFAGHVWLAADAQGRAIAAFVAPERPGDAIITGLAPRSRRGGRTERPRAPDRDLSPDGKWRAFVRDGNLHVRAVDGESDLQLTQDGGGAISYDLLQWSPDSRALCAWRVEPGENKEVFLVESSPQGGGRAVLHQRPYALPGDKFASYQLTCFQWQPAAQEPGDAAKGGWQPLAFEPPLDSVDFGRPRVRWSPAGRALRYVQVDRGHQRLRVLEADTSTGRTRTIVDEQTKTFIWTAHTEGFNLPPVTWLDETDELIYASEVDGWRHLYRIDAAAGEEEPESAQPITSGGRRLVAPGLRQQLTQGEWVVRGVDLIDEAQRQIWFRASGIYAGQDPYQVHFCRVNFDGTGLVQLTDGDGQHELQYSPDRRFIIDTYSRVDAPPIHELRRAADGRLLCRLEEADISELTAAGWRPPEVFVAKGRDGTTDIWGIICRPREFDPTRKYPVLEDIYAGPHGSFVPKTFSARERYTALNEAGFIVVKIDGMGTANRSKAFHDVCWHNLKDAGFPDRILWMQAAAAQHPELDLTRVGIYGGSAGGQNAAAGVLFHPEFYKVAVAGCGCHDNRMDKASWNEQWMGYPVGPQYAASSNIEHAQRLQGKLLLIVGEMDTNVPPESTLRLADALIRADKDFELLVVPGAGHGMGGAYGQRRLHEFFVRHLTPDEHRPVTAPAAAAEPPAFDEPEEPEDPADAPVARTAKAPLVTAPPASFFELLPDRDREAARGFYQKYIEVRGMPVVASGVVADEALQRTHEIVAAMLAGRPDLVQALVDNRMYLIIIGKDQVYTEMPEYRHARNPAYLNERVRGTGGRPTSFGEENLLGWPIDRYDDESIAVHEFCHTIDSTLRSIDPLWSERRNAVYQNAVAQGLWKKTYAASNPGEYWAEIAQAYFDCQRVNNWNHGPIGTREQLRAYDPAGYELVRTTFRLGPDQDWRYRPARQLPNVTVPPAELGLDLYYTQFTWAREMPVVGREANPAALLQANQTIRHMFAYRHDVLKALIADGVRLVVLGPQESLADLPELSSATDAADSSSADADLLARVLDYHPQRPAKLLAVDEQNVLGDVREPRVGSDQVIRVMARAMYHVVGRRPVDPQWDERPRGDWQQYELGLRRLDERFDEQLRQRYEAAMSAGKWQGTAAVPDRVAYWTAGVLAYFDATGQDAAPTDAAHPITTRELLRGYDPQLFDLVHETFAYEGRVDWRRSAPAP